MTQIDTDGSVQATNQDGDVCFVVWSDLSPFTQGYIEAALREAGVDRYDALASETLTRIIADCEANRRGSNRMPMATAGREFWTIRQAGSLPKFPPLTVQLSDDGKVRFAA